MGYYSNAAMFIYKAWGVWYCCYNNSTRFHSCQL